MSSISNPKSNVKFLSNLADVEISSVADDELLSYDTAVGKWVNSSRASVSQLTASNANISSVTSSNVNTTVLTASKANITSELTSSKANISQLTSSNANISNLSSITVSATSVTSSFKGNGSQLTDITSSNWYNGDTRWRSDVRGLFSAGSGIGYNAGTGVITSTAISSISSSGNLTGSGIAGDPVRLKDSINLIGDVTASNGVFNNIYVAQTASIGMLNTLQQQNLQIGDKYITILSGANDHTTLDGAGILFGSGSTDGTTGDQSSVAYVLYRGIGTTTDYIEIFPGLRVVGQLTASQAISSSVGFYGDGSNLKNISSTNITNFTSNVQSQIAGGTNITVSSGTASLNSNISLSSVTASVGFYGDGNKISNITASNISYFTNDVRAQLSAGAGISYDAGTGIITATGGGGSSNINTGATTNLTASSENFILCSGSVSGSVIDIRLPLVSTVASGKSYIIKNAGVGTVNIYTSGSDKIDGASSVSLYTLYSSYSIYGTGSNWWIY